MSSSNGQESADAIASILESLRRKGVRLWSEDGRLHYEAPKGALSEDDIDCLRSFRGRIVAFLRGNDEEFIGSRLSPRVEIHCAPLTFSQLARWQVYRLGEQRSIRQIASATRLHGRLNVNALQKSIERIVRRHAALRTRVICAAEIPTQIISEPDDCELKVVDLATLSEGEREAEVIRAIEQHILEPIDIATGPVFGVRILKLRHDEHVLIVAMEHIISDEFSLGILLRDLFTAYGQASNCRSFSLPAIPIQFADYAVLQKNAHKSWMETHGKYWNERLAGCRRVRFPEEKCSQISSCVGWGTVPLKIGRDLKENLRDWCRQRHTTLAMSVFAAYAGVVLRWCNVSESVIRYQSNGRVRPEIENTIGYFTSSLHLRIALLGNERVIDLIDRTTEEYCHAYEHADSSYIASQVPPADFTRNTLFNWVPQGSENDLLDLEGAEYAIRCSPIRFVHPMLKSLELDIEPVTLLFDAKDEVIGGVHYPLNRFSIGEMERFGRNFMMFIDTMLRQPSKRVSDISLL